MKKIFFTALFLVFAFFAKSQTIGTFVATNNGIATIPLFTLGDPATIFSLKHTGKRFEVQNETAFNLKSGSAWFVNNWLRYRYEPTEGLEFFVGGSYTLNFPQDRTVIHYKVYEAKVLYSFKKAGTFELKYWYLDPMKVDGNNGVKGGYTGFIYLKNIETKSMIIQISPQICHINFIGSIKGFSTSASLNALHKKTGIFAGTQGIKPLIEGIDPSWNVSVGLVKSF